MVWPAYCVCMYIVYFVEGEIEIGTKCKNNGCKEVSVCVCVCVCVCVRERERERERERALPSQCIGVDLLWTGFGDDRLSISCRSADFS